MAPAVTLPDLLDIDQVAKHLGTSQRHIRRLIAEGRIPYVKVGRLIRFDPEEIATWLDRKGCRAPADGSCAVMGEAEPFRLFDEPSIAGQALCDKRSRDSLTEVARSARLVGEAQKRLAEWVLTARDEGHSWRRIRTAAGIAHQTLHRRCRAGRSTSSASAPDLY